MSYQRTDPVRDAARRLLLEGGPDALTMDALAEATGLSRATLYRRVGSREGLMATLAAEGLDVGSRTPARDAILSACREVFTRLGFERATIEDVAEAAGVAPATVYRHFSDKDTLIRGFVDSVGGRAAMAEQTPRLTGDVRADLLTLARTLLVSMERDRDLARLGMIELLSGSARFAAARQSGASVRERLTGLFRIWMDEGKLPKGDPQRLAILFVAPMFAFTQILPIMQPEGERDLDELARSIVDHFLHGALGASSSKE